MHVRPGWKLQAMRDGMPGQPNCLACPDPYQRGRMAGYSISGETRILAEKVTLIQVEARESVVAPGQPVTFDVVTYPGTAELVWRFLREDVNEWVYPDECRRMTASCTFVPPSGGRMQVYGRWYLLREDYYATSNSITVREAALSLECTPNPVTRGNEMNCTAKPEPVTAQLTNVRWTFIDTAGNNIPGPNGDRVTWGGIMVVGGTMHVSAEVNGVPLGAEPVEVRVERRADWRVSFPAMPEPEPSSALPYPPVTTPGGAVGEGVFGQYVYSYGFPAGPLGGGTGPNRNWYYLRAPLEINEPHILINPGLYPDDPFFRAQRGGLDQDGYRRCDAAFMRSAFASVVAHERGHHQIAAEFFGTAGSEMLEAATVYSPPTQDAGEVTDILLAPTITALEGRQSGFDDKNKLMLTCKLQPSRTTGDR